MAKKLDIFKIFRGRKPEDETKKLDLTPVELPAGYTVHRPLSEVIAGMVQQAIIDERKEEFETLDEADDFDMDDDNMLDLSPYELTELQEHYEEPDPTPPSADPQPRSEAPQETITPPEDESPAQVEN